VFCFLIVSRLHFYSNPTFHTPKICDFQKNESLLRCDPLYPLCQLDIRNAVRVSIFGALQTDPSCTSICVDYPMFSVPMFSV